MQTLVEPQESHVPGDGASVDASPLTLAPTKAAGVESGAAPHSCGEETGARSPTGGSLEGTHFAVGDLVWAKTKSHPWWPALVRDPSRAPEDAQMAHRRDGSLLVACFGSGAFAWCEPTQLKPFVGELRRMARQSGSKSLAGAMENALDEIRLRLESELTCHCVPPEARAKHDGGPATVANLQPLQFLEHLGVAACDVAVVDMLEVATLKGWVMAFGKGWRDGSPGFHPRRGIMELVDKIDLDVPPGDLGDGDEVGDSDCMITGSREYKLPKSQKKRSMAALIAGTDLDTIEVSVGDEVKVEEEEKVKAVKRQPKSECEKDMDADSGRVIAQEVTSSGRRERKKSKYLSPPYTCLGSDTGSHALLKSAEVKSPRQAAEAAQSDAFQTEDDTGSPGLRIENTSVNDILSEFLCTARNPLHLKRNRLAKTIKNFFISYRSSMYSSGSDFLTYQKHQNDCCGRKIEPPKEATVYGVGKSEEMSKDRKDAAGNSEVETVLSPDSRSRSEQGKAGRKRKMRKDEAKSVTPTSLDSEVVINVPTENRDVCENIKTKDGAALCSETVSCLQQAEVGNMMNKGKGMANGDKATEPGHHLSECSHEGKYGRKRKKSKSANTDANLVNLGTGIANGSEKDKSGSRKKDYENYYSYPGALLLTFAPGVSLPSKSELISTFTKYGVVIESETELLKETNCARVVFAKSTDAEKAFNSSDNTGVFAPPFVSYHLHYLPPIACSPHQMPPLPYIRESLERMISALVTSPSVKEARTSDGMKPDARENLVGDMEGLLKKVNMMLNGAAAGT